MACVRFLIRLCTIETALYLEISSNQERRGSPVGALLLSDMAEEEERKDQGDGGLRREGMVETRASL